MSLSDMTLSDIADFHDDEARCATPGCREVDNSAFDDFVKCEVCGSGFCDLCVVRLAGLPFCRQCGVCDTCAQPATCLDEDGDLACATHGPIAPAVLSFDELYPFAATASGDFCALLRLQPCPANGFQVATPVLLPRRERLIYISGSVEMAHRHLWQRPPARVIEWPREDAPIPF